MRYFGEIFIQNLNTVVPKTNVRKLIRKDKRIKILSFFI